jgi:hypothetical protein
MVVSDRKNVFGHGTRRISTQRDGSSPGAIAEKNLVERNSGAILAMSRLLPVGYSRGFGRAPWVAPADFKAELRLGWTKWVEEFELTGTLLPW